ncbi:hypothetical protein CEXT_325791 [Caerostris extrusa]|uniref:Uncharacterized protein n=1 Tax=Caerostris extrusa TaxID=172846 RepID=A0AAV4S7H3_CAEEX|nr:hypothetical protein CEXT_325791 [Caerostris extrusa]
MSSYRFCDSVVCASRPPLPVACIPPFSKFDSENRLNACSSQSPPLQFLWGPTFWPIPPQKPREKRQIPASLPLFDWPRGYDAIHLTAISIIWRCLTVITCRPTSGPLL